MSWPEPDFEGTAEMNDTTLPSELATANDKKVSREDLYKDEDADKTAA